MSAALEADLYTVLSGAAGVTALVSTRIYPVLLPPDVTYPAVTYQYITGDYNAALSGDTALERARVQIDAWSEVASNPAAIQDAIRTALGATSRFKALTLYSRSDFDAPSEKYRQTVDYSLWR